MKRFLLLSLILISLNLQASDYCRIVPFILNQEGNYFKKEDTNKGIMYKPTWIKYFGSTHKRFMEMESSDWGYIFSDGYWKAIRGYNINDQRVAEVITDWSFNSGTTQVAKSVDKILGLPQDGKFDDTTINAINSCKVPMLWLKICQERIKFYKGLVYTNPTKFKKYLNGWLNRVNDLITFEYLPVPEYCK